MGLAEKDLFFQRMEEQGLALTFDDVRLDTAASDVAPTEVDLTTRFSRNVELKTPLVSAAMDTITESDMAIAIAKLGGIGVVHAALSVDAQKEEVRRVKLHLNGLIEKPITFRTDQSLEAILNECEDRRFDFRTFPIVDSEGRFAGLLTQNDIDFAGDNRALVAGDIMTPAGQVTTASGKVSLEEAYDQMQAAKKKTLPLVAEDGTVQGLYIWSDVARLKTGNRGLYNLDEKGRLRVAAAVPTDPEALERVAAMQHYLDVAVIDTAQGDSKYAFQTLEQLKEAYPDLDVVVGNITSADSARRLAEIGADGIKVGQGPGSICTTRIETGIGHPQVSAVYRVTRILREFGIPVCADGGLRSPGDLSIAIAAGAHSVMMGSMLAATKETPGEEIMRDNGRLYKVYRGMGSAGALRDSAASRKRYGVSGGGKPLAEGVETELPYRGSVVEHIDHYLKALRKSMSYVGAPDVENHRQNTQIFRITNAGYRESTPHINN